MIILFYIVFGTLIILMSFRFGSNYEKEKREINFQKTQSGQCPGAVAAGFEEEHTNNIYYSVQTKRFYKNVGNDFLYLKMKSIQELMEDRKNENRR